MEHSTNFEKIRSYFADGFWTEKQIADAAARGWITSAEMQEIIGSDGDVELLREAKIAEISKACNSVIVAGFDLTFGEGEEDVAHFNLSVEDQSNIANLFRVVELGGTEFPYQADGGVCRIYSAAEIAQIYITAQTVITTQTTYHNALKAYVQSLEKPEKIAAVEYGMELPKKFANEMNAKLAVAQEQMTAIVEKISGQTA